MRETSRIHSLTFASSSPFSFSSSPLSSSPFFSFSSPSSILLLLSLTFSDFSPQESAVGVAFVAEFVIVVVVISVIVAGIFIVVVVIVAIVVVDVIGIIDEKQKIKE